jgi:hypothetical protein
MRPPPRDGTAAMIAARGGHAAMARELTSHGGDIDQHEGRPMIPLVRSLGARATRVVTRSLHICGGTRPPLCGAPACFDGCSSEQIEADQPNAARDCSHSCQLVAHCAVCDTPATRLGLGFGGQTRDGETALSGAAKNDHGRGEAARVRCGLVLLPGVLARTTGTVGPRVCGQGIGPNDHPESPCFTRG